MSKKNESQDAKPSTVKVRVSDHYRGTKVIFRKQLIGSKPVEVSRDILKARYAHKLELIQ